MPEEEMASGTCEEKIATPKKMCAKLASQDRRVRKQVYIELQIFLSDENLKLNNQELRLIFTETHMYILNGLRDNTELVREQAIKFLRYLIIDKLPLNDFYLTYIFPILVERVGTVELVEESEEIRLQMLQLLDAIISKYSNTAQLKPFLNDSVLILAESVKDKYPAIKELSCYVIMNLAKALPADFHMQSETLIKPVLTCFCHQRYKVRMESINAVGELVLHGTYKGLDEAIGPLAEKLFDQIPAVRRAVARNAARWLFEYKDRYSFFHKILPLLLTGLCDEIVETRIEAQELWEKVGLQYQQENEKDFKDELDYLIKPPKYYPANMKRPNLGCRALVKRNVSKLAGAISRELMSWQEDVRVRCSQLLCVMALHAEDGLTLNLQELLPAMYSSARDDDSRVVVNIRHAAETIGVFIKFETWSKLIVPAIEDGPHYGHLTLLAGLVKGSPEEYIKDHVEEVSMLLAEDLICYSRKKPYQLELKRCMQVLAEKHDNEVKTDSSTGYNLFKIIVALVSLRHLDNSEDTFVALFEDLKTALKLSTVKDIWMLYAGRLLKHINVNPKLWTTVTDQACIFLTILAHAKEALGENLEILGDILIEVFDIDTDGEMRLKTFYVLASTFEQVEVFQNMNLAAFLERLIKEGFIPSLVWHAGASAEAIRTMAASCLRYALMASPEVDLFPSGETLRQIMDELLPLLISLVEDASHRSRLIAIECLLLLKESSDKKGIWTTEDLIKIYPEIMKRLDDPTEKVRLCALKNISTLFEGCPDNFKRNHYKAHHEMIIDTLLTHFDDDDEAVQEMVYRVLKVITNINKTELLDKMVRHKPLLRNQKGCQEIIDYCENSAVMRNAKLINCKAIKSSIQNAPITLLQDVKKIY